MPPGARKHNQDTATVADPEQQQLTIPAPSSGEPAVEPRPTTVPDYDVSALAAASFHGAKRPQLPLDLAVPVRKERASVCGAPLRAAFLLSHVDDRQSIAEIAASAQLPISDAIEAFVLLADLGVVELRGSSQPEPKQQQMTDEQNRPPTPKSGLRPKT